MYINRNLVIPICKKQPLSNYSVAFSTLSLGSMRESSFKDLEESSIWSQNRIKMESNELN